MFDDVAPDRHRFGEASIGQDGGEAKGCGGYFRKATHGVRSLDGHVSAPQRVHGDANTVDAELCCRVTSHRTPPSFNSVNLDSFVEHCQSLTMGRPVGRHHGDLRRGLIRAALELVAESTPDAVTLRAVARRAGVSAAAPYHHFEDRDALFAAVARDGFDELTRIQDEVLHGRRSSRRRLETMVERYVCFGTQHRTHYRLMFRTVPTEVGGVEGDALRAAALASFGRLVDAVEAAASSPDAAGRAIHVWALAHGAVEVGQWGEALTPGTTVEQRASAVGKAAGLLVCA